MIEQWKDVVEYEGFYQVSNQGRVRSVDRVVQHRLHGIMNLKGRVLKPVKKKQFGYYVVGLHNGSIQRTVHIHRIVATAWIGPCPTGYEVCHGRKGVTDNSVSNLCYGLHSKNMLDRRRDKTGGIPVVRSDGEEFDSITIASEESNCGRANISRVCNGRAKSAGGYGWKYL